MSSPDRQPFALRARQWLGVALREWPNYRCALARTGDSYTALCNRGERLERAPDGSGWRCEWKWTSDLNAPRLMPQLGRKLMARALADHPVRFADSPVEREGHADVAFVIGHRGESRAAQLLATLRSIAAQAGVRIQCVVVEQDDVARVRPLLPSWVEHVHTPPPADGMPYARSWAFNVGVRASAARIVVLHDNDMIVPHDYARTAVEIADRGFDAMNLKRFIFYLSSTDTQGVLSRSRDLAGQTPASIMQNAMGGSVVITREAFIQVGGMDESFVGWGGEDNEFWERCETLRHWPWGMLPFVHLWHAPQAQKGQTDRETHVLLQRRSALPAPQRIDELSRRPWGSPSAPRGAS